MDKCWRCADSLSTQSVVAPEYISEFQAEGSVLPRAIGDEQHKILEANIALRAIAQLFLRKRTRRALLSTGRWPDIAVAESSMSGTENSIEHLDVLARHHILHAAASLLYGWPDRFVEITQECGITRADFCGASDLHPRWVEDVITRHLSRQNRGVTSDMVRAEIRKIREEGLVLTKALLRRRLKWQGDIDPAWLA